MSKVDTLIEAASAQVRVYVPALIKRMGLTYLPPVLVVLVINAFGTQLLENFIPLSTATILVMLANIAILVYGWRYLEKRYSGLGLYMQFLYFTKARRDLGRLVKQDASDKAALTLQTLKMEQAADDFIRAITGQVLY